ncbi:pre-rRNA processing protein associated with U3 snRNP, Rrp9p [Trichosporon asahii var. asahii CBS 8904]|uniref:Pre-rRNA processing protein associated with U3 snRNP, Rrp9p n=1 Tax=Trichosporon asahii var. asahii (strain CBS 8904) TaxID=1220162 RepID=K1WUL0_TRIAC|nr:pre-rRNA processing protein associated with U3 snRNP, Rrp9p [Trichosporon asahii var. asahii CBS 8904]
MPDAFFKSDKKRKRSRNGGGGGGPSRGGPRDDMPSRGRGRKQQKEDEDLSDTGDELDIDDMDFQKDRAPHIMSDDEFVDANETAAEKRVRLARGYLDKVARDVQQAREEDDYDAADIDRELIASRLKQEVDEAEGRIHMFYSSASASNPRFKALGAVPTGVGMVLSKPKSSSDGKVTGVEAIYVSTKGGVQRLDPGLKNAPLHSTEGGHQGPVLCMAASEDGKWLVTGGQDRVIGVAPAAEQPDIPPPLCLSLAPPDTALALDALATGDLLWTPGLDPERLGAEADDVEEEVQLVLRAGGKTRTPEGEWVEGSVDVVTMLDDSHFVSGGDTGSIALWSTGKKKPLFTHVLAHGTDSEGHNLLPSETGPKPRWITALAHLRGSNLFASGSWDGEIKFWKIDSELKRFEEAGSVNVKGFVNAIQILNTPKGIRLVAAVGREPRLGRWVTVKARNGVFVADVELEK